MHEECRHGHRDPLVASELLAGRIGKRNRQELEEAIAHAVQNHVGGAGRIEPAEGAAHDSNRLEQTCGGECRKERREDAGDDVQEPADDVALLAFIVCLDLAARKLGQDLHDLVVDIGDMRADHDLVLALGMHDLDDALKLGDLLVICLALILQTEAQARDAVRIGCDIVLAAHQLDDAGGKLSPVPCHVVPPPLSCRSGTTGTKYRERPPALQ